MSQTTSKLDQEPVFSTVKQAILAGETNATIAAAHGTSEAALRRFRIRHQLSVPGQTGASLRIDGDQAEASTEPSTHPILDDPDTMLSKRGLDPKDWVITHITPNMYEGPVSAEIAAATGQTKVTYYQTKFTAARKKPSWLEIPRADGWRPRIINNERSDGSRLVVITGDQQAPFLDYDLHEKFLLWLDKNKPQEGVLLGDTVDFGSISRHRADPENEAFVNECLQTGYDFLRDYVYTSEGTTWKKLAGNHDERIRNLLLDDPKAKPLFGIKRPDTPEGDGEDLLGLPHILRLDELGIEYVDPHGAYDLGEIALSDKLAVRHGWLAQSGSGKTALASLKQLGYSIIVGHTHRQSIISETKHQMDKELRTLMGVEAGCMCRVSQKPDEKGRIWPNYTTKPDWQQGFATAQIWDDGSFNIDTAKFVNGKLLWRDQRY